MRAVIEPRNDTPYFLSLSDEPEYTYNIFGGCLSATLPCSLTDRQRAALDLARVSIYGSDGLVWQGCVWDKPDASSPLVALGPNLWLGFTVRAKTFTGGSGIDAIISDCLDQLPASVLPAGSAYRAFMQDETSTDTPLDFDASTTELDKVTEAVKYAAYAFGWYAELIGSAKAVVPHYTPLSTTPDYVTIVRDEDEVLPGSSMEPLANKVRVLFNGGTSRTDVLDTDPTHILNILGVEKWKTITVETTSTTAATQAGVAYLVQAAKPQVKKKHKVKLSAKERRKQRHAAAKDRRRFRAHLKTARRIGRIEASAQGYSPFDGSMDTIIVRTMTGAVASPTSIRPGQMVRLLTRTGPVDVTVSEVACKGERSATLTLDNTPNRVETLLAKAAAKAK